MEKTLKFTINIKELEHYVGILSEEKKYKNKINIIFVYYLKEYEFLDYSLLYNEILDIVFSKHWKYIEEMAKSISENIINKHENMKKVKIKIEKLNPLNMKYANSVSVEYEKNK